MSETDSFFAKLPEDAIFHICSFLDADSILKLLQLSHFYKECITNLPIWKNITLSIGFDIHPKNPETFSKTYWYNEFRRAQGVHRSIRAQKFQKTIVREGSEEFEAQNVEIFADYKTERIVYVFHSEIIVEVKGEQKVIAMGEHSISNVRCAAIDWETSNLITFVAKTVSTEFQIINLQTEKVISVPAEYSFAVCIVGDYIYHGDTVLFAKKWAPCVEKVFEFSTFNANFDYDFGSISRISCNENFLACGTMHRFILIFDRFKGELMNTIDLNPRKFLSNIAQLKFSNYPVQYLWVTTCSSLLLIQNYAGMDKVPERNNQKPFECELSAFEFDLCQRYVFAVSELRGLSMFDIEAKKLGWTIERPGIKSVLVYGESLLVKFYNGYVEKWTFD